MSFGLELWSTYLDRHAPKPKDRRNAVESVKGQKLAKLLWPMREVLTPRHSILNAVTYNKAFEPTADDALRRLAIAGTFDVWETLEAGAWKVLEARWGWSVTAVMIEAAAQSPFSIAIPRNAPQDVCSKAAILYVLGTPGRTLPLGWSDEFQGVASVVFPGALSTRRQ